MQRVILVILFTFWAFMTYRLWQVEYAGQSLGDRAFFFGCLHDLCELFLG